MISTSAAAQTVTLDLVFHKLEAFPVHALVIKTLGRFALARQSTVEVEVRLAAGRAELVRRLDALKRVDASPRSIFTGGMRAGDGKGQSNDGLHCERCDDVVDDEGWKLVISGPGDPVCWKRWCAI